MGNRLNAIEVIRLDPKFTRDECQSFIEQWNADNPEKSQDDTFMPLFSPFIDRCDLIKGEDEDTLTVIMKVTPDNWPGKQEVAEITFFVTSLKNDYEALDVKMMFEVIWG